MAKENEIYDGSAWTDEEIRKWQNKSAEAAKEREKLINILSENLEGTSLLKGKLIKITDEIKNGIIEFFQQWRPENGKNDLVSINKIIDDPVWGSKAKFTYDVMFKYNNCIPPLDYFDDTESFAFTGGAANFLDHLKECDKSKPEWNSKKGVYIDPSITLDVWLMFYRSVLSRGPSLWSENRHRNILYFPVSAIYVYYGLFHSFGKISQTAIYRMDYAGLRILFSAGQLIADTYRHGKREGYRIRESNETKGADKEGHKQIIRMDMKKLKTDKPWVQAGIIREWNKDRLLNKKGKTLTQRQIYNLIKEI